MGWSSAGDIAEVFAQIILKYVPKEDRLKVGKVALESLTDQDWDCIDDVEFFEWVDGYVHPREEKDYKGYEEEWKEWQKRFKSLTKKFTK